MRVRAPVIVALAVASVATPLFAKDLAHRDSPAKPTGCEWAGEGYVKLPGTETCVKTGGFVRAESSVSSGGAAYVPWNK